MKGSFQTKAFFCLLQNIYNTGRMQGLWTQAGKLINQGTELLQVTLMQVTTHSDQSTHLPVLCRPHKAWDRHIQPPAAMGHGQEGLRPALPGRFGSTV